MPRKPVQMTPIDLGEVDDTLTDSYARGMRVIGYVRTDPNDTTPVPPNLQRQLIETWCADRGARLIEVFEDLQVPANESLSKRTGLAQALNALLTDKSKLLLALSQDRLALLPDEGVAIELLATQRYEAHLDVVQGEIDWGAEADEIKAHVAQFVTFSRQLDDALQNDDTPDDWEHIQTAANLAVPRQNPATGRAERPSMTFISEELNRRGMISRHGTAYSPAQVSRMLERWEVHMAELQSKARQMAEETALNPRKASPLLVG